MTPQSGALVGGRYRLNEPVGRGGMGRVWLAHDQLLDRDVAIKEVLLPPELDQREREIRVTRTVREARAAARLNHSSVITIHDVVEHDGTPWIVMEYIPGRSLGAEVTRNGPLSWQRAAEIGAKIADALAQAHAAGIVHRDLKPDNVLLSGDRVIVTDFGIARMIGETNQLTSTGMVVGTANYMAPEQLEGTPVGPAADIWSLGATLYTAVEGKPPFEAPTLAAVVTSILRDEPKPSAHAGPLAPVISRFLDKNPARRPSAVESVTLLRNVHAVSHNDTETMTRRGRGGDTEWPPGPGPAPAPPSNGGTRRLLLIGVPIVLAAVAIGGYLATKGGSTHSTPPPPPKAAALVGDSCLVGTWQDGAYEDSTTWDNSTVYLTGGAGNLDHIYPSGIDDNTYGSYSLPFLGTYNGSTLQVNYTGTRVSTIRATPRTHLATVTDSGWTSGSAPTFLYQGKTTTGTFNQNAASVSTFTYSCTATTLTWISDGTVNNTETRVSTTP
jgi:serine/threonine protein kinase